MVPAPVHKVFLASGIDPHQVEDKETDVADYSDGEDSKVHQQVERLIANLTSVLNQVYPPERVFLGFRIEVLHDMEGLKQVKLGNRKQSLENGLHVCWECHLMQRQVQHYLE